MPATCVPTVSMVIPPRSAEWVTVKVALSSDTAPSVAVSCAPAWAFFAMTPLTVPTPLVQSMDPYSAAALAIEGAQPPQPGEATRPDRTAPPA